MSKTQKESTNKNRKCKICKLPHAIWMCRQFQKLNVPERWNIAKTHRLCYRCLGAGHRGKICLRSRRCGLQGCKEVHNRLLHTYATQSVAGCKQTVSEDSDHAHVHRSLYSNVKENAANTYRMGYTMEGNRNRCPVKPASTIDIREDCKTNIFGLRTVPVILKNGSRQFTVNALLDDASTHTYINADIATRLGLHGQTEEVTLNVLTGNIKLVETTS